MKNSLKGAITVSVVILTALVFIGGNGVYAGVQEEDKKPDLTPQRFFENFKNKKFMGEPLDFELKEVEVKKTIEFISRISGLTFTIEPGVEGTVTFKEKSVPWDRAFYHFLEQNELELVLEEDTLVVRKKEKPEEE